MNLEYFLAKHRRKLEHLKILTTFKYSGIIGIILTAISKGLIIPQLEVRNIFLIFLLAFFVVVYLDNPIFSLKNKLITIKQNIKELNQNL